VRSVDSKDQAFRYHALLRDMLAAELHRAHPREEAKLHVRAAGWYAERGEYDLAVPHAIASGDADLAGRMIWSQAAHYSSFGRDTTLERWLDRFTEPQVVASPYLCLTRATCCLGEGDGAAVAHWAALAVELASGRPGAEAEGIRVAAATIAASGAARDGVVAMGADAGRAFERLAEEDPWRSLCRLIEGVSRHLTGHEAEARVLLEEAVRRAAISAPTIHVLSLAQLALLTVEEGDLEEATRLSREAVAAAALHGLADLPTQALNAAVAGYVEGRGGNAASASDHVRRAITLLDGLPGVSPWYQVETRIVVARTLALLDDIAGARAQLAAAGRERRQDPEATVLTAWMREAWKEADAATANGRWPLSPAELRLLHYLPTHLSFREIADELFVSQNTVKTQARSVYQKLGVSSRAEAVTGARTAGLIRSVDSPVI
jgi:LuxR family maltose regulon positive regulatory protein